MESLSSFLLAPLPIPERLGGTGGEALREGTTVASLSRFGLGVLRPRRREVLEPDPSRDRRERREARERDRGMVSGC